MTSTPMMTSASEHRILNTEASHRVYGSLQRLIGLLVALALVAPVTADAQPAKADWTQVDLGAPVSRLFTPSSGAFFAQTSAALMRSDDGGATWAPVSLPSASHVLAIDPTNHQVVYAAGQDGVYVSRDDAATWNRLLAYGPTVGSDALALAVSPADPNLLYLGVAGSFGGAVATANRLPLTNFWFLRSKDGGSTWESLEERHYSLCGWEVSILRAHPSNSNLVFRSSNCLAGRIFYDTLTRSSDQGRTWEDWSWSSPEGQLPDRYGQINDTCYRGYPTLLVGGQGAAPQDFYLAVNRDSRIVGSLLVRTDDDGATSKVLLDLRGPPPPPGGSTTFAACMTDPDGSADTRIQGLAYDPAQPDHVFVGFSGIPSIGSPAADSSVLASLDGGTSWASVGCQSIGPVNDLALGIDGRNLYAATDTGVWRLALGDLLDPNNLPMC
jgi:hypothetical protein